MPIPDTGPGFTSLTVLVTGASGFIGCRLVPMLEQDSWTLRLQRRRSDNQQLEKHDWWYLDLQDQSADLAGLTAGVDVIVHLAGKVHDANISEQTCYLANCDATLRLAEAAAASGVRHFIFISTLKVNGEGYSASDTVQPAYTELSQPEPRDAYARSKWAAEQAVMQICGSSGMTFTIIRPPLVFGPGVKANFLALMNVVSKGLFLPLAAVKNQRSFIYVDNLCDFIIRVMHSPAAANKTYVIADMRLSTPELIGRLAKTLGVRPRVFSVPAGLLGLAARLTGRQLMIERLTQSLVADDSRARLELDWQPPIDPDMALQQTAAWFRHSARKSA